jgi:hypothetical protein
MSVRLLSIFLPLITIYMLILILCTFGYKDFETNIRRGGSMCLCASWESNLHETRT